MKVAFEVGLNVEGARGYDRYIEGLLHGLSETDQVNDYTMFTNFFTGYQDKVDRLPRPKGANFKLDVSRWPEVFSSLLKRAGHDVLHKHGEFDGWENGKKVLTVFDTMGRGPKAEDLYAADAIVVISEHVKRQLTDKYVNADKIHVTYLGVDAEHFNSKDKDEIDIEHPYLLHMGPLEKRRNTDRVLEALYALKKDLHLGEHKLVITGTITEETKDKIAELGLYNDVILTGRVAETDLPELYRRATALVHPGLGIDFGLPILEAMACGTAVICSYSHEHKEMGLTDTIMVDPLNTDEIRRSMRDVIKWPNYARETGERGREAVKPYTWERVAQKTLEVYKSL